MIFVTAGTDRRPFDRLLEAVAVLSNGGEPLYVQHGPSTVRPEGATCTDYLSFDEVIALVDRARVVVSHAGVGSVAVALRAGKRPIVMPRRRRAGEHVDDHQVHFAHRLRRAGLAVVVEDTSELRAAMRAPGRASAPIRGLTPLAVELRKVLYSDIKHHPDRHEGSHNSLNA